MAELLTQKEAAALLRCSESKVKRLRLAGLLAFIPGRPLLIRREDLEDYLERAVRPAERLKEAEEAFKTDPAFAAARGAAKAVEVWRKRQAFALATKRGKG